MGGTIMKHQDTVFHILCLTQGGDCDTTTGESRLDEVRNSWDTANVENAMWYFTKNRLLKEKGEDEWVNYIESDFMKIWGYDCIFTPSTHDSHFEHKIVSNLGWPLTRITPTSLIEYYSPSTLETWNPNIFVDIDSVYDRKVEMLKEFKSQQHRSYFQEDTIRGFHTHFQCSKKGKGMVEQFRLKQQFV